METNANRPYAHRHCICWFKNNKCLPRIKEIASPQHKFLKIFWGGMPPDPPRSSALRASLLPLRGNYISHSIQTKNLGIYAMVRYRGGTYRFYDHKLFSCSNHSVPKLQLNTLSFTNWSSPKWRVLWAKQKLNHSRTEKTMKGIMCLKLWSNGPASSCKLCRGLC